MFLSEKSIVSFENSLYPVNIVVVQKSSLPNRSEDIERPIVDVIVQIADMLVKSNK